MTDGVEFASEFDDYRQAVVEAVNRARDRDWNEDDLAEVLAGIGDASIADLRRIDDEDGYAMLAGVEAWASVASYAMTRFYFEGPNSVLRRGGQSKPVSEKLADLATTWGGVLRSALKKTHASSFSIAIGFPFGIQVGLTWEPTDDGPGLSKPKGDEGF